MNAPGEPGSGAPTAGTSGAQLSMRPHSLITLTAIAAALASPACNGQAGDSASAYLDGPDCRGVPHTQIETASVTIQIDGLAHTVLAEVAQVPTGRQHGLACRSVLTPRAGMLFIYPEASEGPFWMYNTYVPLDVL